MGKIVPLHQQQRVATPRAPGPGPARRPVRALARSAPAPHIAIDEVAQPPQRENLWDVLPFTHIEVSCQRIERVGQQTHISQRDIRLEDGVVETQRFDGVVDADVCDEVQRRMAYTALGEALELIFSGFELGPLPPHRK